MVLVGTLFFCACEKEMIQPDPLHIVIDGFPGEYPKYPVEMERGEVGYL